MRTATVLVATCFAVLTVAACQAQGTASGAAGAASGQPSITTSTSGVPTTRQATMIPAPPPVITPVPIKPSGAPTASPSAPPGQGTRVPPGQVDTSGMTRPPDAVLVNDGGRDVVFNDEQGGCQQISAQATSQTATVVTILVTTTSTNRGNQVCPLYIREVPIVVQLTAPLGNRMLVFHSITKHD